MSGVDHAKKKAVRARMAITGESYKAALRATEALPSPSIANVTLEDGRRFRITVGEPPHQRTMVNDFSWPHNPTALEPDRTYRSLDSVMNAHGWQRVPGAEWPAEPALEMKVAVELTDEGVADDALGQIHREHGLTAHTAHEPYMFAVADALDREGVAVLDRWANGDDPRGGGIELEFAFDGDKPLVVAWREDFGWYYVRLAKRSQSALGNAYDLPVSYLDEPHQVARAVREAIGGPVVNAEPVWSPPAGYKPDAISGYLEQDDSEPLEFERSLCSYTTHPAWKRANAGTEQHR